MPFDPGGGTGSDMCSISPSELASNVDNLIDRVRNLEQQIAQLVAADVSADQLSDLSESAGWLTDITYMGMDGWTQTPAGTLIPPPGWDGLSSVIDGASGTIISGSKSALHRTGTYASDISASSGQDITINSTPSATVDMTLNGTAYFTPGSTDPSGHAGWLVLQTAVYIINIYMDFDSGSAVPTAGDYQLRAQKRRTNGTHGTLAAQGGTISSSGWSSYSSHKTLSIKRILQAGEYLEIWAYNFTDGDIRINTAEMVVTSERVIV